MTMPSSPTRDCVVDSRPPCPYPVGALIVAVRSPWRSGSMPARLSPAHSRVRLGLGGRLDHHPAQEVVPQNAPRVDQCEIPAASARIGPSAGATSARAARRLRSAAAVVDLLQLLQDTSARVHLRLIPA